MRAPARTPTTGSRCCGCPDGARPLLVFLITTVWLACGSVVRGQSASSFSSELNFNNMQLKQVPHEQMCSLVSERNRSQHAPHVNYLSVAGNQIEMVDDDAFKCVGERLRIVDLSQNRIRNITSNAFEPLERVQVLLLDENLLEDIPSKRTLSSLRSLRHLSMAGNRIRALSNGTFFDDTSDSSDNSDDKSSKKHRLALGKTLLTLDMRSNPLERIEPNAFFGLANLVTVTLSQTKLNGRFGPLASSRQTLGSLRNIHLDRSMNLSSIDANLCTNLPKLATLTLSSNRFEQVPRFESRCGSLLLIDLSYNLISGHLVEDQFKSMPSLIDLYLGHNLIDTIESGAFNGLSKLQVLALNNNRLKHIDPSAFLPLSKSIYELNLASNSKLNYLTNLGLDNLSSLKVYGNKHLKELPYFRQAQTLALTYAYHCCDYLRAADEPILSGLSNRPSTAETGAADLSGEASASQQASWWSSQAAFWSRLRQILLDRQSSSGADDDDGSDTDTGNDDEIPLDTIGSEPDWPAAAANRRSTLSLASAARSTAPNRDRVINVNGNNLSETIVWPKAVLTLSPLTRAAASSSSPAARGPSDPVDTTDLVTDSWLASGRSKRSFAAETTGTGTDPALASGAADANGPPAADDLAESSISGNSDAKGAAGAGFESAGDGDGNGIGDDNNEHAGDAETLIDELVEIVAQRRRLHAVANYERWTVLRDGPIGSSSVQQRLITPETSRLAAAIASALGSPLSTSLSPPRPLPRLTVYGHKRSKRSNGNGKGNGNSANGKEPKVEVDDAQQRPQLQQPTKQQVTCRPAPDAFLPCKDLFDGWLLRAGVWSVFVLGFTGNLLVIIVLLAVRPSSSASALTSIMWLTHSKRHIDVPRFLVINLAVADLLMAIYLGLLAFVDASTYGSFRQYAIKWQHSFGCKLAAFFAVLSSELSVFILAIITLERNYAITNAVHLNRRLSFHRAALIMFIGYAWALLMAILPLEGVSDYRRFSICLPLDYNSNRWSRFYTIALISINSISFLLLFACYLRMYCAIRGSQAWNTNDLRIAKRMSTLVLTDFLCWAPILCVAIASLFGHHLVGSEGLKALTIFVLPLNSVANPFLYAITTKKFKRDLRTLIRRTRAIVRNIYHLLNRSDPSSAGQLVNQQTINHATKSILVQARLHENGYCDHDKSKGRLALAPNSMTAVVVDRHRRCCVIDRAGEQVNHSADAWRSSKRYRRRCHVHSPSPQQQAPPPEIHICQHGGPLQPCGEQVTDTNGVVIESTTQMRQVEAAAAANAADKHSSASSFDNKVIRHRLLAACATCGQQSVSPPIELVPSTALQANNSSHYKPKVVVLDTLKSQVATNDDERQVATSELTANHCQSTEANGAANKAKDLDAPGAHRPADRKDPQQMGQLIVVPPVRATNLIDRARSAETATNHHLTVAPKHQAISCHAILILGCDDATQSTTATNTCPAPDRPAAKAEPPSCCQADKVRSVSACGFRLNEHVPKLMRQTVVTRCASSSQCGERVRGPRLGGFIYEETANAAGCGSCDSIKSISIDHVINGQQASHVVGTCCCRDDRSKQVHRLSRHQHRLNVSSKQQQQSTNSISRLLIHPIARAWSSLHLLTSTRHTGAGSNSVEQVGCCGKTAMHLHGRRCPSTSSSSFVDNRCDDVFERDHQTPEGNDLPSWTDRYHIDGGEGDKSHQKRTNARRMSRSCDAISSSAAINEARAAQAAITNDPTTGATTSSSYDYYDDRRMLLGSAAGATAAVQNNGQSTSAKEGHSNLKGGPNGCSNRKLTCARCRSWSPAVLRDKIEDCLRKITGPHALDNDYALESTNSRDLTGCATESSNLMVADQETDLFGNQVHAITTTTEEVMVENLAEGHISQDGDHLILPNDALAADDAESGGFSTMSLALDEMTNEDDNGDDNHGHCCDEDRPTCNPFAVRSGDRWSSEDSDC